MQSFIIISACRLLQRTWNLKWRIENLCIVQVWVPPSNRDVWKSASCYSVVKRQISILKPAVSAGCHFLPDIGQPSCPPLPQNGPQENSIHTHPIHPDCMTYFWLSLICLPAKKIKVLQKDHFDFWWRKAWNPHKLFWLNNYCNNVNNSTLPTMSIVSKIFWDILIF